MYFYTGKKIFKISFQWLSLCYLQRLVSIGRYRAMFQCLERVFYKHLPIFDKMILLGEIKYLE